MDLKPLTVNRFNMALSYLFAGPHAPVEFLFQQADFAVPAEVGQVMGAVDVSQVDELVEFGFQEGFHLPALGVHDPVEPEIQVGLVELKHLAQEAQETLFPFVDWGVSTHRACRFCVWAPWLSPFLWNTRA